MIYFILIRIVTIEHGCVCAAGLAGIPIPSSRSLWEAEDAATWMRTLESQSGAPRIATFQDLALNDDRGVGNSDFPDDLFANLDGLGTLAAFASNILC